MSLFRTILNDKGATLPPATPEQSNLFKDFHTICIDKERPYCPLRALCLVPKASATGDGETEIHMDIPPGGLGTCGDPTYMAWYRPHYRDILTESTILVCPYYPLMSSKEERKGYGQTIYKYFDDFLDWIYSGDLVRMVQKTYPLLPTPKTDRYIHLLSGESAGANLAIYCWLSQRGGRIGTMYLQSGMYGSYCKLPGQLYMDRPISREEAWSSARDLLVYILKKGPTEAQMGDTPPMGMGATYLCPLIHLPTVIDGQKVWRTIFKILFGESDIFELMGMQQYDRYKGKEHLMIRLEAHDIVPFLDQPTPQLACFGLIHLPELNAFSYERTTSHIDLPGYAPNTFITHGDEDVHCPIQDAQSFTLFLQEKYPESQIELFEAPGEKHAFAYHKDDEWTRHVTKKVSQIDGHAR
ncbi:hypothetical protein DM02DRAFT_657134 [Periconia macrospinosa]|uniref:Alpha/beta-hydrolase n=1 Tax=Periconia macrospinosa TaxID=97972 RepID=A0A2V1DKG7_9PLEO|nr:hypothetical protein DM02DRAFT_657134 [Periconia macrospinosa]